MKVRKSIARKPKKELKEDDSTEFSKKTKASQGRKEIIKASSVS